MTEFAPQHGESFSDYRDRVHELLPNIPDDVLEQWVYEHRGGIAGKYSYWDLTALQFDLVSWSTDSIPTEHIGNESYIRELTNQASQEPIKNPRLQRLDSYFAEHRTWPRPVLFLENTDGQHTIRGNPWYGQPYHLVEGHHRLACLIARRGRSSYLAEEHEVWVVSVPTLPEDP